MNSSIVEFVAFEGLEINTTVRIAHGIVFPIGLIISSIFYWGTIYYERYVGDPMKRTIQNRFISAIAFSTIMNEYTATVAFAWRIQIGPLNDNVAMVAVFINTLYSTFVLINLSETIIYKVIYLLKYM